MGYLFPVAAPAAAGLALLGAAGWPRPGRSRLLGWCALTAATTVAAALAGRYPLGHGRLLLHAAPGALLLAASGVTTAAAGLGRLGTGLGRLRAGARLAPAIVALYALAWSVALVRHRYRDGAEDAAGGFVYDVVHDVEAMIVAAEARRAPEDEVMVSKCSGEAFRYYARGRLADALVCTRVECRTESPVLRSWLETVGDGRGWLLLLAEDDEPARRRVLQEAGFVWSEVARSRGARLWRVTRAGR
jgi:hypothetical protein